MPLLTIVAETSAEVVTTWTAGSLQGISPVSGTFALSYGGETTSPLYADATDGEEALLSLTAFRYFDQHAVRTDQACFNAFVLPIRLTLWASFAQRLLVLSLYHYTPSIVLLSVSPMIMPR